MDSDSVWRALASHHRRAILDLLRDGPKTTGQLARAMPDLSRFAVMQHLGVLEEAKLVLYRKDGTRRFNYSNAAPLLEMYERWVSSLASRAAEAALQFKRYAESNPEKDNLNNFRRVQIETEIRVNASAERCFDALTRDYNEWFPHRFKPGSRVWSDAHLGGTNGEEFPDGGGAIHATVLYVDPPRKIVYGGPGAMMDGMSVHSSYTLEPDGGATVVKRRLSLWGDVSEEFEKIFRDGTRQLFEQSFIGYLERGEKYQAS